MKRVHHTDSTQCLRHKELRDLCLNKIFEINMCCLASREGEEGERVFSTVLKGFKKKKEQKGRWALYTLREKRSGDFSSVTSLYIERDV